MAAATLPLAARLNNVRRTDRHPLARPRSLVSANACCFLRRSIVRTLTLKNAAISASVHCNAHRFSSSTRLIFTALRPAPDRAPPAISLLPLSNFSLGFPLDEPLGGSICQSPACPSTSRGPPRNCRSTSATSALHRPCSVIHSAARALPHCLCRERSSDLRLAAPTAGILQAIENALKSEGGISVFILAVVDAVAPSNRAGFQLAFEDATSHFLVLFPVLAFFAFFCCASAHCRVP